MNDRRQFESWYISKFLNIMPDAYSMVFNLRNKHGGYDDPHIDGAWESWKVRGAI